jgi:hypothetical protein
MWSQVTCFSIAVPRTSGRAARTISPASRAGAPTSAAWRTRPGDTARSRAQATWAPSPSSPATPMATSGAAFCVVRMKATMGTLR